MLQSMGSQRVGHDLATEQQEENFRIKRRKAYSMRKMEIGLVDFKTARRKLK